jgi:hypothetical protein
MWRSLFCALILPVSLFAGTLADEFQKASLGDFVILRQPKLITCLRIADRTDSEIIIEEVTGQEEGFTSSNVGAWLQKKPYLVSWTATCVDRKSGKVRAFFTHTGSQWMETEARLSFLPALLSLPLGPMPLDLRKRIGVPPEADEHDTRKLWLPRIVVDGKELSHPEIEVFRVTIPREYEELAGRHVTLYIPRAPEALSYFPYWVEVGSGIGKVKLQAIDSGRGLMEPVMNRKSLTP